MSEINQKADITIAGAGLVGLAAALAFHQAGYDVQLVDAQPPQQQSFSSDDWDKRIYAISPRNAQWLESLGAWQLLDAARITEIQAMEIWGDATAVPLQLLADDANEDTLGFIVEESALKAALLKQLETSGVRTTFGQACDAIITNGQNTTLRLSDQRVITSSLLLAADGANSPVRKLLGISTQEKPYHQTAIVANFVTEKFHDNIARQWFTQDVDGHVGIMAWLPLPENKVSMVWSVSTQHAENLLKLSATEFTQQVMLVGNAMLGNFDLMDEPAAFPLILKTASQIVRNSAVLVGDAAHRIHPMAGQGVNLGFRDVIDLLVVLSGRHQFQRVNDATLLKHYARMRKMDLLNMTALTNGLYHLFDSQHAMLKKVRNWGLDSSKLTVIKKMLVSKAVSL